MVAFNTLRKLGIWRCLWAFAAGSAALVAHAATGTAVPALAAYDREVEAFLARWSVPGAAVAVARDGRLLFARGYGVANPATGTPVQPDALFRVASVSKPITATAILKLVEDGGLTLDLPVFPYLARGTPTDSRVNRITVRHLLEHTAGWDSATAGDPAFMSLAIAAAMAVSSPPDTDTTLRWMLRQPLQFEPGSRYAYSNFGYMVLGEVVAKASGQRYEDYVRTMLLRAGITRAALGRTLPGQRLAGEVSYAMPAGSPLATSVFAGVPGPLPRPDGSFALETIGSAGAWVVSAIDLVAFVSALDGQGTRPDLLNAASLAEQTRRGGHESATASYWYGKGFSVNSAGNAWHLGSLPGTTSIVVRTSRGFSWAAVVNLRPNESRSSFESDLDDMMWRAFQATSAWPDTDQFAVVQSAQPIAGCFGTPAFSAGQLCLPVIEVPSGSTAPAARYTATLALTDAATLAFALTSATPVASNASGVPAFDASRGVVDIPRVLLLDPSGVPRAWRAKLQLVPGGAGLNFRVVEAAPL